MIPLLVLQLLLVALAIWPQKGSKGEDGPEKSEEMELPICERSTGQSEMVHSPEGSEKNK